MTRINISGLFSEGKRGRIMAILSVPVILAGLSLLALCIRPLSSYVMKCYPEIIGIAVAWMVLWAFILIGRKLRDAHPMNLAVMLFAIIITMAASFPFAKKYALGRYMFYSRGLYAMSYDDVRHIESAIAAFEEKEWDSVKSHLDSCSRKSREFFSYSTSKLLSEVELMEISKRNFTIILNKYQMTPLILSLYESLANDFGGTFQEDFASMRDMILTEINNIDKLYEAIDRHDPDECMKLLSAHGYYWFEKEIIDTLLNSDNCIQTLEKIVMKDDKGVKYKENLAYVWGVQ